MYHGGICFVTDRKGCTLSTYAITDVVLKAGIRFIQYREKNLLRREIHEEAVRLREVTYSFGATLIINDHVDIALSVDADGVHLGQEDLPLKEARKIMGKKIVGISTHNLEQAREAERGGADYIGFGPIFPTLTKVTGSPKGIDSIRLIKKNVNIPFVAIGGIQRDNMGTVFRAGADAVALATAICRGDVAENAKQLVASLKDNKFGLLRS